MQFLETSTWYFLLFGVVCSLLPSASGYENAVIRGEARQQGRTRDKTYFPIHPPAAAPKVRARGRRSSKHFSSSRHRWTTLREPAPESASDRRCTTRWKAPHKEKLAKRISREMDWAKYAFTEMKAVASRLTHWELWCDCDFVKTRNW